MLLTAGRISQLMNYSDIARNAGADTTTIQSWLSVLVQNGLLRKLPCYSSNLNQRLIKSSKYYFEDVGLATRLQGWRDPIPIVSSPQFGFLLENIAVNEVTRFFINQGQRPQLYYVRTKEKVEIDLLIELPNQKYIAAEIKSNPQSWATEQHKLIDSLKLNVIEKWCLSPTPGPIFGHVKTIEFKEIWNNLTKIVSQ